MKRLMIYPYSMSTSVFSRYSHLVAAFDEVICISPFLGSVSIDACEIDGGPSIGRYISGDPYDQISEVDSLLLHTSIPEIAEEKYRELIRLAKENSIKIYLTRELAALLDWPRVESAVILEGTDVDIHAAENQIQLDIDVPVVNLLSMGPVCNSFDIQIELYEYIKSCGYEVICFGSETYASMFGMREYPEFLFDESLSTVEKVKALNYHIYTISKDEKPDLILFGVPGGIMNINPYVMDEMGEIACIISSAVKSDFGVLTTYSHSFSSEFFSYLQDLCRYKFSTIVPFIHIANRDVHISDETLSVDYVTIPTSHNMSVLETIRSYNSAMFFNVFDERSRSECFKAIVKRLEEV